MERVGGKFSSARFWSHKNSILNMSSYNPGQDIWGKVEKSSKIGQGKKSLISTFACFWLLLPKFNFWRGDWALGYVST